MDKTERETHDFMNVDSFSQLPFIRPAPSVRDKAPGGGGSIRLFGKEFGGKDVNLIGTEESESGATNVSDGVKDNESNNNIESGRKFECHYCCRNFPTSQALGGHQNAHKRERQHAKRAHLQSTMAHNSIIHDGHLYGSLVNFRPNLSYPTWNNYNSNNRFYGFSSHHHEHQTSSTSPTNTTTTGARPINGNPLGLWRSIPATHHQNNYQGFNGDRSMMHHQPLPLFAGDHDLKSVPMINVESGSSQNRHVYESSKGNVQDHYSSHSVPPSTLDVISSKTHLTRSKTADNFISELII